VVPPAQISKRNRRSRGLDAASGLPAQAAYIPAVILGKRADAFKYF